MRATLLLVALAACRGEFTPMDEALERYRDGRAHLERGEPAQAAEAFAAAIRLDPTSTSLVAWHAHALAEAGDLEGAARVLSERAPSGTITPLMRYNRACYLARLGRAAEALDSLQRAVREDPALLEAARTDPDLAPLAAVPGFDAVVGPPPVLARMTGEEGAVLVGEPYDLVLEVAGPPAMRLDLTWTGPDQPGFEVRRIVDEVADGGRHRTLAFTLRAGTAGEGTLGPWRLGVAGEGAPGRSVDLPAVRWQVVAPPGVPAVAPLDRAVGSGFWCPAEVLAGRAVPSAGSWLGRLLVVHAPSDRVEVDPDAIAGSPLVLEVRDEDQVRTTARAWPWVPGATHARVRVRRGPETVLDTVVRAGLPATGG